MSDVLDSIRAKVGTENCIESCSRDGCDVDMTDLPTDCVIVDVDKAFPAHELDGKRCDFVLFAERSDAPLLVAPVELKSGDVDVSEAVKQLRGGAAFAERIAQPPSDSICRPVLIHGKGLHRAQRTALNRSKVAFRGDKRTVKTARCGGHQNLARALKG